MKVFSQLGNPFSLLPKFPGRAADVSLVLSLLGGSLLGLLSSGRKEEFLPYSQPLDVVTGSLALDPWLWQLFWAATISVLVWRIGRPRSFLENLPNILLPFFLLVVMWVVGDFFFKPAFGYTRPPLPLGEPPFTALVRWALERFLGIGAGASLPSGFVLRQVGLTLLMALLLYQKKQPNSPIWRGVFHGLNILLCVLVIFLRYSRGEHDLFDIALTLPMGTVLFWFIAIPFYRRMGSIIRKSVWNVGAGFLLLNAILLPYAEHPENLIVLTAGLVLAFGLVYAVVETEGITTWWKAWRAKG